MPRVRSERSENLSEQRVYGGQPWVRVGIINMNDFLMVFAAAIIGITMYSWGRSDGEYKTFKYFMDWMKEDEE